jgi:LppP/LprE lipoprotein
LRAANTMGAMRGLSQRALALSLGVTTGALLGACGSNTKTVSVAGSPPATQTTATTAATTTRPATTPSQTTTNGGTATSGTTRSAPEPAFTQHETSAAEGVSAAAALVRTHGFTPNNTAEYHPSQTLRVLLGTRTGSGDGYGQRAFFFVGGRYIGTDASEPSATLKVLAQSDTEVTLAYPLYRHNDPLCCASGGQTAVRFQLDNGKLTPLDPIPPASSTSSLSRY